MNKQTVFATLLKAVGFDLRTTNLIHKEWYQRYETSRLRNQGIEHPAWHESVRDQNLETLTVGRIVSDIGDLTWSWANPYDKPPSEAFKRLVCKLLELGLTVQDWPLLAPNLEGVLQEHVRRAGGVKEEVLKLPVVVIQISGVAMKGLEECIGARWFNITVGQLLAVHPRDFLRASPGGSVYKSLADARAQLRSLGLTDADGQFLSIGSRKAVIEQIALDLNIDHELASRTFAYMKGRTFDVYD